MPQSVRLTAALSIALLTLLAGCSLQSNSPRSSADSAESATKSENPVAAAKKPAIPSLASPDNPDPAIQQQVEQYLNGFAAKGFAKQSQGMWIQAGNTLLANHQGTVPLPAASLTKVATSLAALQTFSPNHQFITQIGATGPIENGVLKGD